MEKFSIKNQNKVLKKITSMCYPCPHGILYEPQGFENNFPHIPKKELCVILDILASKDLIEICYGDYPDSFNIWSISVTTIGYNYIPQVSFDNRERWKERIWGFVTGSLFTALANIILQIFL